jgi:two-component system phosphate regulon response regulator PhoB
MASVLVIDRDPVARKRITLELRALGYDVAAADQAPAAADVAQRDSTVSAGGISIDIVGHWVVVNDDFVTLSPREYRLLLFLLNNRNRVFSRRQLLTEVWGPHEAVGQRTVDVHIRRLRSLLESYDKDSYIQTVRGAGYRFSVKP